MGTAAPRYWVRVRGSQYPSIVAARPASARWIASTPRKASGPLSGWRRSMIGRPWVSTTMLSASGAGAGGRTARRSPRSSRPATIALRRLASQMAVATTRVGRLSIHTGGPAAHGFPFRTAATAGSPSSSTADGPGAAATVRPLRSIRINERKDRSLAWIAANNCKIPDTG